MSKFILTKEMMYGAYEYLLMCPPFTRLHMPDAEEVSFFVIHAPRIHGDCGKYKYRKEIFIRLSTSMIGRTHNLIETMGHEMIHGFQEYNPETKIGKAEHDPCWHMLADELCDFHGFDRKLF